ncbi:MAG: DUF1822 family protein [Coleofasciculus sp. S288]|nr:DUF1822 family protein [Coleofasciculus sp. S288]
MMKKLSESSTFIVPLGWSVHARAKQFCKQQSNPQKAKQVYLNTLAVSAVDFYLRCMGIKTDWEASQSCNPIMHYLTDVADLEVENRGKLECIPVLPSNQLVHIPLEAWSDRIGYVAVQFDPSLEEATLLGFTETVPERGELLITQLRSLDDLLEHLRHLGQPEAAKMRVNLSQWLENCFEAGWQSLEALLGIDQQNLAFSFRHDAQLSKVGVQGVKLIDFGVQLGNQSVALLIALTLAKRDEVQPTEGIAPETEEKLGILVQVHPVGGETYLPPNLKLCLLSESGKTLQEVQSRSHDNYIQLRRFRGQPGECFNIQVALGAAKITETFVI